MDRDLQERVIEAQALVRAGKSRAALESLLALKSSSEGHVDLHLNLAMIHRQLGELNQALAALDQVLAHDPYSFIALLSKGSVLEQMGSPRRAAEVYKNALKIAPNADRLPL